MGTYHGDSGNPPPDGDHSPDEPLDLPPEWGEIVIPDDASALAAEAEQVRRELAEQREGEFDLPGLQEGPASGDREPSVGVPLLIMSVAVVITLLSLFAMAWSGSRDSSTNPTGTGQTQPEVANGLRGLVLEDAAGQPAALTAYAPMAILLIEDCPDCMELVAATAATAPAGVSVAAVGQSMPQWPPQLAPPEPGDAPLLFTDPDRTVRAALDLPAPGETATVVLVDQDGQVTRTVATATTVDQFRADLGLIQPDSS